MVHIFQQDAFQPKKRGLFGPVWSKAAGVVNDTVAGKVTIIFGKEEHPCCKTGVFRVADEGGNLAVGRNAARRSCFRFHLQTFQRQQEHDVHQKRWELKCCKTQRRGRLF